MRCAWNELLSVVPTGMRSEVDKLGKDTAQNLRLRLNAPPELNCGAQTHWLDTMVTREDLNFCVNVASRYSPWAATTISRGYITARGGHRIGICGEAVIKNGEVTGLRELSSVCIRIARDYPGVSRDLSTHTGSTLILGAPGWGKTTLLRDLIRQISAAGTHVCVLDEREELFPPGLPRERGTDVLSGCTKPQGADMLLKVMEPEIIAMDEITSEGDCDALIRAAWCGVRLMATAHAASLEDFLHREVYTPLVKLNIFDNIVILRKDKSWYLERSKGWTTSGLVRY